MQDYIFYFFIYAIIGWILEVSFHVITKGKFINRGFFNGPYCPIYGFGAVAVILLLNKVGNINKLLLFFVSMIIATLLELVTGFILEKIFHKRWWDYTGYKFNLGGYICAEFSLIWGAACFILYEAVHPLIKKATGLIPIKVIIILDIILGITFLVDFISTIITIMGLSAKFKSIENQSKDIKKVSDGIGQKVADRTFIALDKKKEFENSRLVKEFDERSAEFKAKFDSFGEERLLRAYPNLIRDLEDKWENRDLKKRKEEK
jgi:hypothetical protein